MNARSAATLVAFVLVAAWWHVGMDSRRYRAPPGEDRGHAPPPVPVHASPAPAVRASRPDPGAGPAPPSLPPPHIIAREALDNYVEWARYPPDSRPLREHPGLEEPEADHEPSRDPPAIFTGQVREVLEHGSLTLWVGVAVRRPGRYEITARVDDAAGKRFALLRAYEELGAGPGHVRLRVFGKLARDEQARAPFHLRDLSGLRRLENAMPDAELMPTLAGRIHTTATYGDSAFSPDDWQSEEKDRHLRRFLDAVDEADHR